MEYCQIISRFDSERLLKELGGRNIYGTEKKF